MDEKYVAELLREASTALRSAHEENHSLRSKLASFEARAHAEDLILRMEERGMDPGVQGRNLREKAAALVSTGRSLDVIQEAVNLNTGSGSPFSLDNTRVERAPIEGRIASLLNEMEN